MELPGYVSKCLSYSFKYTCKMKVYSKIVLGQKDIIYLVCKKIFWWFKGTAVVISNYSH